MIVAESARAMARRSYNHGHGSLHFFGHKGAVVPIVDRGAKKRARFQALVEQWRSERGARSSISEAAMTPAYQSIIGMGEDAIPLIIAQLKSEGDEPDQWFWALRAITGANPVDPSQRGNFPAMAKAWIVWSESDDAG